MIGALLALDGQWQKLEKLRILMGDEVSRRTKKALLEGVEHAKAVLDTSIEKQKETDDFLSGVPAIVEAIRQGQIECRVYTKEKFHAKAYITPRKGSSRWVLRSCRFKQPGISRASKNVELNVQLRREVEILQEWFERHWNDAARKLEELERKYDKQFAVVFEAIRQLTVPPEPAQATYRLRCRGAKGQVPGCTEARMISRRGQFAQ